MVVRGVISTGAGFLITCECMCLSGDIGLVGAASSVATSALGGDHGAEYSELDVTSKD